MLNYDLPEAVAVNGTKYPIRSDFRAALDIIAALNDPELTQTDKAVVVLRIFYSEDIPQDAEAALRECFRFLDGGEEPKSAARGPRLMDWEQDFQWIIAPINRVAGRDVRGGPMHWWTFLSHYYEIGDCYFAQLVRIRELQTRGKPLDKADREWAAKNADQIRLRGTYTKAEEDLLAAWLKGDGENA